MDRFQVLQGSSEYPLRRLIFHVYYRPQWLRQIELVAHPSILYLRANRRTNGGLHGNSMDAISFVLGIKSSHLRSAHLKDLIYRGRVLRTSTVGAKNGNGAGPSGEGEGEEEQEEETQGTQADPRTAWVMAVYEDDNGEEQQWKRSITNQGASEYRINGKQVTAAQYNAALEEENILIKARNFLVFQVNPCNFSSFLGAVYLYFDLGQ